MIAPTLDKLPADQARQIVALAAAAVARRNATQGERRPLFAHQTPPPQPWDVWLLVAGRGAGKTEAGSRYVDGHAKGPACLEGPVPHRIAIVSPSHDDAVETCVRGETGLLQVNRAIRFRPGAQLAADLTWPNGAQAELFGTFAPEDVERFRGPQHCLVWGDEFAAWRKLDDSWAMIEYGLRLGPHPHAILTTTPKRRALLKSLMADEHTVVTTARTADNPALPEDRRAKLYARYGGTAMGRQELDAQMLDDVAGALWKRDLIRYAPMPTILRHGEAVPDMVRIVVAVDPAVTSGEDSDETGIVVVGIGAPDGRMYVLDDLSGRMGALAWARRAVEAYRDLGADRIIAEANNGGDLVEVTLRQIDPNIPVRLVHASRGKRTRAEPVAALYEQGRVFHVKPHEALEDQMCSFTGATGESSPDRMDALVWAITELAVQSVWQGASDVAVA